MSRHRHIRNLDYEAELDDYDGNDYADEEQSGGMTKVQEEKMKNGLKEVRKVLGDDVPGLTAQEIRECLWHYYFDVEQTISYILNIYGAAAQKSKTQTPKKPKRVKKGSWTGQELCGPKFKSPSSQRQWEIPADFWEDAPWGHIPEDRRAIIVAPSLPKGGLLGGKLAALAKARKAAAEKKEEQTTATGTKSSVSLLSRLENKKTFPTKPFSSVVPSTPTPGLTAKIGSSPLPSSIVVSPAKLPISPPLSPVAERHHKKSPLLTETSPPYKSYLTEPKDPPSRSRTSSTTAKSPGQSKYRERDTLSKPRCIHGFPTLRPLPSRFAISIFGEKIASPGKILFANDRWVYFTGAQNGSASTAFASPSPDDVVKAAQSRSKGLEKTAPASLPQNTQEAAEGMQSLNINSAPIPEPSSTADIERIAKSRKNLNILEEYKKSNAKENVNFVVIGHVDAGKSTIMGRILYDMGVVDERTIQKYKREAEKIGKASFAFAWVLDETKEERSRGITMDIAMNKFETPKCQFTILDAPGHKDFVPNMIAGASQADFAVLVIDASGSNFEAGFSDKGQTKEHTQLVRSLGVQRIVVAVNKLDAVGWSQERFEDIRQQMSQYLTAIGFQPKNVSFIPCSGLSGGNIVKRPARGEAPWYKESTLLEELGKSRPLKKAIEKPFRLTIGDVFKGGFTNPVSISGRIQSGGIQIGDILLALPSNEKAAIKGIDVDERPSDWAVAGHNVNLHLGGIDIQHLKAGDILCDPKNSIPVATSFKMKILAFEAITPMMVDVHRGKLNMAGKINRLISIWDKSNGEEIKKKPRRLPAGSVASIEVEILSGAMPVETGTRIVLRCAGITVAAGLVEYA